MPRFVILRHELPPQAERSSHWDLMFEFGAVLRTWAIDQELLADRVVAARALADHRLDYLNYEGPVGGNRGQVTRCDAGEFAVIAESPERLAVELLGSRYRGRLDLECHPSGVWYATYRAASKLPDAAATS